MKLAIAGLCLLGIVAAACAAVVVNGLRFQTMVMGPSTPKVDDQAEVVVLYVTRTLSAMTVVDGSMVSTKTMRRVEAPAGYITNPIDVVGKIISTPLAGGQPFTKSCFADVSGPRQLAAVIPRGKRAVGISVSDYAGLDGLIYPGSIVDVMVSFRSADSGSNASRHDAVTTTLLENIQVLAFEQQTVVSPGKVGEGEDRARGTRRVALLVDTKQSKTLELAMEQGTLSLALRNPLDSSEGNKDAVSIRNIIGDPANGAGSPTVDSTGASQPESDAVAAAFSSGPTTRPDAHGHYWDTTIIRGRQIETRSFALPPTKGASSDAVKK
jgi:Flp pilus assembly protein CpaB